VPAAPVAAHTAQPFKTQREDAKQFSQASDHSKNVHRYSIADMEE
jgi:hypothetical protein